jgi:hypothetical protein
VRLALVVLAVLKMLTAADINGPLPAELPASVLAVVAVPAAPYGGNTVDNGLQLLVFTAEDKRIVVLG